MKIQHISPRLRRFLRANRAVSALEYAILVGVITVAVGAALVTFSDTIADALETIGNQVDATANTAGNTTLTTP